MAKLLIFLYTQEKKDFDKSIPLFNVPNRKVFISDDITKIQDYKYVMIEGVGGMIEHFRQYIDYYLIFIAPRFKNTNTIQGVLESKVLDINHKNKDIEIWSKNII